MLKANENEDAEDVLMIEEKIPKTMKAVVTHGPGDYRMEEVPVPRAEPGEVVVKVLAAGICAGDAKCYAGAPLFWGDETKSGFSDPPVIAGHEFVGRVVELGRVPERCTDSTWATWRCQSS